MLFAARAIVDGMYSGKHKSPVKGLSPEFVEYKNYTPGDPMDSIDWKAFARTDRHYIKLTEQETNMNCHLVVDCSASMAYRGVDPGTNGDFSKYDYAATLAAALSYLVVQQRDKVSLTLFDRGVRQHVRTGGTFRHMHAMLDLLSSQQPAHTTDFPALLRQASGLFRRRGLLIVLSDFYVDTAELFRALNIYRHRHFEVILFHILHADEYRLPAIPNARFTDLETRAQLTCAPEDIRAAYDRQLQDFIQSLRSAARARRMDYNLITTETPYAGALRRYLWKRNVLRR